MIALALILLPSGPAASQSPAQAPPPGQGSSEQGSSEQGSSERASYVSPEGSGTEFVPGRVIVKAESDPAVRALESVNDRLNTRTERTLPALDLKVVEFDPDRPVGEVLAAYRKDPRVEYAEPDFIRRPTAAPNDPLLGDQWPLQNTGQSVNRVAGTPGADIDASRAWDAARGGSATVALVDTGVDIRHPDLRDNVWTNPGEVPGDGVDNDGNGRVDDVNGWNFFNDNATVSDEFGGDEHGTHTAGTLAAAADNGEGVSGVAPGAEVMPLKACGADTCSSSAIVSAFDYAVQSGAKVVNGSFGSGGFSRAEYDAIERGRGEGVLFVFPAGNAGTDNDTTPFYPASYDNENVVSAAASDNRDELAGFSSYGGSSVDVAAPGVSILSTGAPSGRAPVAVRAGGGAYRSIYAGFGLEQISGAPAREGFLEGALSDLSAGPATPVLLVDDDGGAAHETPYKQALASLGYTDVEVAEVSPGGDGPSAAQMQGKTVVWLTGAEYEDTLRPADRTQLTDHLDGGGDLLLMGQDIGFDVGGGRSDSAPTAFYTEKLKARLADDDFDPGSVSGTPGGPFGESSYPLTGGDSASYERYVDRLDYEIGGSAALLSDAAPFTYRTMSGTSMAAPHVSGVAALLASRDPSAGYGELKSAILASAEKTPGLDGRTATGGRLNASAALARISPPALAPRATSLSLSSSKNVAPYRGETVLTGRLSAGDQKVPRKTVTVWRSENGGGSWERAGTAAYDPASGSYRAVRSGLGSSVSFRLRFAGDAEYEPAASPEVFVGVQKPTRLAVSASKNIVPYGGKVALGGRLTDLSGRPLANRSVAVWRSENGGRTWQKNGLAEYRPATGGYRAVRALTSNTTFQLRFERAGLYTRSVSAGRPVKAKAYLSKPINPWQVQRGEYFFTRGIIKPRHAGHTRLVFERRTPGGWRHYRSVNVRNAPRPAYMAYGLRHKLPAAGLWRVRAFHADPGHAPTWSPVKLFVVRP